ncbi:hypothetical protein aldrigsur_42 [Escherichia phage aldrigsur]|uniref:Uncharacterized protein n=1 Tax=Escherichia phage altidsur TaxID=2696381 RepID=A0A6B9WN28_9CAUD|nr:hypothetical protein altidsur_13 [Escherichia phage altidsur]QHR68516.1 hypothetical protein aldrigsur_42 [Escherichia phage aldrigsur]
MTFKAVDTRTKPLAHSFPAALMGGQLTGTIVATIDDTGRIDIKEGAENLPHFAQSRDILDESGDFLWLVDEDQGTEWDGTVRWGRQEDFEVA